MLTHQKYKETRDAALKKQSINVGKGDGLHGLSEDKETI